MPQILRFRKVIFDLDIKDLVIWGIHVQGNVVQVWREVLKKGLIGDFPMIDGYDNSRGPGFNTFIFYNKIMLPSSSTLFLITILTTKVQFIDL